MDKKIEKFIGDLKDYSTEQAEIVTGVRKLYCTAEPSINEKFIYGGIGFFLNDELIGGVYAYKQHVSIVFSRGNELADPKGQLEGGGKFRRHLKILTQSDVDDKDAAFFIHQSIELA